jgi:hypothetical protein
MGAIGMPLERFINTEMAGRPRSPERTTPLNSYQICGRYGRIGQPGHGFKAYFLRCSWHERSRAGGWSTVPKTVPARGCNRSQTTPMPANETKKNPLANQLSTKGFQYGKEARQASPLPLSYVPMPKAYYTLRRWSSRGFHHHTSPTSSSCLRSTPNVHCDIRLKCEWRLSL